MVNAVFTPAKAPPVGDSGAGCIFYPVSLQSTWQHEIKRIDLRLQTTADIDDVELTSGETTVYPNGGEFNEEKVHFDRDRSGRCTVSLVGTADPEVILHVEQRSVRITVKEPARGFNVDGWIAMRRGDGSVPVLNLVDYGFVFERLGNSFTKPIVINSIGGNLVDCTKAPCQDATQPPFLRTTPSNGNER